MRYLIKYTKGSEIKYVSHLELMRTIQRIIRRSELPVEYSRGFNPHMSLSIAQPLAVGVYSKGEYMDVHFNEELDEKYIEEALNKNAPSTIKFLDVKKIKEEDKKVPQAMAAVEAARYILKFKLVDTTKIEEDIKNILNLKEWLTIKKGKKEEKTVNLKELIKDIDYRIVDNLLILEVLVSCGSKENLSAQLLGEYLRGKVEEINKESFIDIEREDMYAYKGSKLIPLNRIL